MHKTVSCCMCKEKAPKYIRVLDEYICEECERVISTLDMDDVRYEYYNIIFKKIWHNFLVTL
ncbi:sigma factor G inhibitor Gin [Crassaminicella indica]|uniref:Sigma factor G inhibitor Gin n=2 Tax=Crassaminicella indica TaxID=2855394 RepID=A0ABX8RCU5_9CLOT|nr:sigma factor G inhibitor Gin [Crassaminicella indica]